MELTFRRRILVVAVSMALLASGCVEFHEVAVENQTNEPLLAAAWQYCDRSVVNPAPEFMRELSWQASNPGTRIRLGSVSTSFGFGVGSCIVVANPARTDVVKSPLVKDGLYEVTRVEGKLRVAVSGDYPEGQSLDLSPSWLWIVLLAISVPGAAVALFVTGRFFYRYYVRGAR
jgi:hypothetical protein